MVGRRSEELVFAVKGEMNGGRGWFVDPLAEIVESDGIG